jgi:hypothetical protein
MDDRTQNRLNMVGACLAVADSPTHQSAWQGQEPAAFADDLAELKTAYTGALAVASQAAAATEGAADQKDVAETALENAIIKLRSALRSHYKTTNNLVERAKVNLSDSKIQKKREQDLLALAGVVLGLANAAKNEPGAVSRGVTNAHIATLTASAVSFEQQLGAPRGKIVTRSGLLRELETRVAGLVDDVKDLNDLVIQFDTTDAGRRFIAAWQGARTIVDAGHGPSPQPPAPPASS